MNPCSDPGEVKVRVDSYERIRRENRELRARVDRLTNHVDRLQCAVLDIMTKVGMPKETAHALLAEIATQAGDLYDPTKE